MVMGGCLLAALVGFEKISTGKSHAYQKIFKFQSSVLRQCNLMGVQSMRGGLDHEGGFQISAKMHGKN